MKQLLTFFLLFHSSLSLAIDFQEIAFGGNGCKYGEDTELYIFEDYGVLYGKFKNLKADNFDGKKLVRTSCNMAATVKVPEGRRAVLSFAEVYGEKFIGQNVEGKARAEVFFASQEGQVVENEFLNNRGEQELFTLGFDRNSSVGECGKDVVLRLNTSVFLKSLTEFESSNAFIDYFLIAVKLEDCAQDSL